MRSGKDALVRDAAAPNEIRNCTRIPIPREGPEKRWFHSPMRPITGYAVSRTLHFDAAVAEHNEDFLVGLDDLLRVDDALI